jgi:threonine/homoserine/homoserine lactone efflux protein
VITHFLAFLGVSAVVIVTPGQDTALTIRNTLLGGRRAGTSTALGVSAGQAVWALATSAGVAALLRASEPAFLTIKLAGAAYLVWLGLRTIFGH